MLFVTLFCSKFEIIQLQREKSATKSNESISRCFLFCKCWGLWHSHYLQILCNL